MPAAATAVAVPAVARRARRARTTAAGQAVSANPNPNPDHDLAPQREGYGAGGELRPAELLVVGVGGREDLVRVRVRVT